MTNPAKYISGYDEFIAALTTAEKLLGDQNLMRRALMTGARLVRDEARSRVSVWRGYLKRVIQAGTSRTRASDRRQVVVYVNLRKARWPRPKKGEKASRKLFKGSLRGVNPRLYINPRRYGHLVEWGSRPRVRTKSGGYSGRMPARPFLFPAWQAKRFQAYQAALEYYRRELPNIRHRVRRRTASRSPRRRAA